jgi:cbb3-type cytochrome oxidase subunit 3
MTYSGWINFVSTILLFAGFITAVVYYYNPKREAKVEAAKYRMLEDDDENPNKKDENEKKARDGQNK